MKITTELQNHKQKALIITKIHSQFINLLKNYLAKFSIDVFISPELPESIAGYSHCFFINETHPLIDEFITLKNIQFVFIFFHSHHVGMTLNSYAQEKKAQNIKIITLETSAHFYKDDLDTILWFTFSRSEEIYLHIYHPHISHKPTYQEEHVLQSRHIKHRVKNKFTKKNIIIFVLVFFFLSNLLFIPPLLATTYFNYQAAANLKGNNIEKSKVDSSRANTSLQITQGFYSYTRPILLLFSIALYSDDWIQINKSVNKALASIYNIQDNSKPFISFMMRGDKTLDEENEYRRVKDNLITEFDTVEQEISLVSQKLPTWNSKFSDVKKELTSLSSTLNSMEEILPYFDTIFAKDSQKTYLLLFANNMELRPGGGFIGSFGLLTVKNNSISKFDI